MSTQLELCKVCANRKFSSSQGIVCGLTDQKPTFFTNCPDYEKDIKEEERIAKQKAEVLASEGFLEEIEDEKPASPLRVIIWIVIFAIAIIRLVMRCSE